MTNADWEAITEKVADVPFRADLSFWYKSGKIDTLKFLDAD